MEKKLVLRGMLAGLVGGVLAFLFARIFAEPQIQKAIDYEGGRDAAHEVLEQAAGSGHGHEAETELFSRAVQSNVGLGVGLILTGVAFGALYGIAYTICLGRTGKLRPRPLALAVAGAGFMSLYFVPFIKYPANPPAIGNGDTIKQRSALYLLMVVVSLVVLFLAVQLGKRLQDRLGTWNATLVATAAFTGVVGVVMFALPQVGHLAEAVNGVRHATDTPPPLLDDKGTIVYPGFPADVLAAFREYSVAAQLILWTAIGLVFAPLADRLLPSQSTPAASELQVV
jgi:hypothetical protein